MRHPASFATTLHRGIAALGCAVLALTGAAHARTCVRATIDEAYLLPDGSRHEAGPLRICLDRDYSPVSGLHTIVAGNETAGAFLSRREKAETEGPPVAPRVAFVRDRTQTLVLRGYVLAAGDETHVYWIETPRARRQALVAREAGAAQTFWLAAAVTP